MNHRHNRHSIAVAVVVVGACASLFGSCSAAPTVSMRELVPTPIDGWAADGETLVCNSLGELTARINGGAPFFFDRGVHSAVFQDYESVPEEMFLKLEIYRVGSPEEACALRDDVYMERPISVPEIGDKVRIAENLVGAFALDFCTGNLYAKVTITAKTAVARQEIVRFAVILFNRLNR